MDWGGGGSSGSATHSETSQSNTEQGVLNARTLDTQYQAQACSQSSGLDGAYPLVPRPVCQWLRRDKREDARKVEGGTPILT